MNPTAFAHPEWALPLAAAGAAAALCLWLGQLRARRRSARLFPGGQPWTRRGLGSDALLLAALAAIGMALVGPRIGERTLQIASDGVDVVFLVDVSRSMDATDVPPSRLDRARRAVEELLARLAPADRAALAVFGGSGALLTPLTPDHGALAELLPGLDSDLFRPASSRIGAGVAAAVEAFEAGSRRPRVLFVLSDGEDPDRRRDLGAPLAVERGVRVVTAAIGSDEGGAVPADGAPLRDAGGQPVVSRRDGARLAALAAATDGAAFAGDAFGRFDFDAASAAIRRDVSLRPGQAVARRVPAVRVAPFAALAFGLLLCEGLPLRRGRIRSRPAAALAAALLLTLPFAGLGNPATARARSADDPGGETTREPRAWIAAGLAALDAGDPVAASRAFLAAAVRAREPEVAAVAHYDLGVAALAAGEPAAARDAFFETLALDPSDREARFNLEWALALVERAAPEAIPPQAPEAAPPRPTPGPEDEERGAATAPTPTTAPTAADADDIDPEQGRRWLERVRDDPSRWLRSAAGRRGASGGGPAW